MFCRNCNNLFIITDKDRQFYNKMSVPEPTRCPDCRFFRRIAWRNEFNFYPNACSLCGQELISTISKTGKYKVLCRECYWSDGWDPSKYGRDFDFSRPFFEQFNKMLLACPAIHLNGAADNVNSVYSNYAVSLKDCYMYCSGGVSENVYYAFHCLRDKDCVDVYTTNDSELCHGLIDCDHCYNVNFAQNCNDCLDSAFIYDCKGCKNCFCSTGLRNASFVFKNKQLSSDEYQERFQQINLGSHEQLQKWNKEFSQLKLAAVRRPVIENNSQECVGEYIRGSSHCYKCHTVDGAENGNYCDSVVGPAKDLWDCTQIGLNAELLYETLVCSMKPYNNAFGVVVRGCTNTWYCQSCHNSQDCFGCVNLNKKKYCIFNKQYSEKDYFELREKIIAHMKKTGEWGEFFPASLSPYGYNETALVQYAPLNKEEALAAGWNWQNSLPGTFGQETLKFDRLPDDIKDVDEDIIKEVLACEKCQRNYKVIAQEFNFYKKQNLPVPRLCFNCRHLQRFQARQPREFYHRKCMRQGCSNEFETTYSPERPERVYCEECYQKEIY